jgi:voltage-gated potassium channel
MEIPSIIKELRNSILLFGIVYFGASILFYYFEHGQENGPNNISDALWYTMVTISTVGYGDLYPVTTGGRIVGIGLIFFTLFFLFIMLAKISNTVMEANLMVAFGMKATKFKGHTIICGWSPIGRVALKELLFANKKIAVITEDQEEVSNIRMKGNRKDLAVIFGDPSNDEVLLRAGTKRALTVIICTEDDTKNLIVSLHVKKLNPRCRIIVSIKREELRKTLEVAGVTYILSPYQMSGRLVASAAFEPEVAKFVEDVSTATRGYDLQQFVVSPNTPAAGKFIGAFSEELKKNSNTTLVAISKPKKGRMSLIPNPDAKIKINPGDILIILGTNDQLDRTSKYLGIRQGI